MTPFFLSAMFIIFLEGGGKLLVPPVGRRKLRDRSINWGSRFVCLFFVLGGTNNKQGGGAAAGAALFETIMEDSTTTGVERNDAVAAACRKGTDDAERRRSGDSRDDAFGATEGRARVEEGTVDKGTVTSFSSVAKGSKDLKNSPILLVDFCGVG